MKNLGPRSLALLAAAGITTLAQLRELGAVRAYARVQAVPGHNASLNLLWALEGSLSGQPWQAVAWDHRLSLLLALDALQDRHASATRASRRPSGRDKHRKNS